MFSLRSARLSMFIAALLSLGIFMPTQRATAVDAQTAGLAKMIGAVLLMHGLYSLNKDVGGYMTGKTKIKTGTATYNGALVSAGESLVATHGPKIPLDLLEVAGGAAAMMINGESENDMKDSNFSMPSTTPSGGDPGGAPPGGDVIDTCKSMPEICNINSNTNKPQLSMPPKEVMQAAIRDTFAGQAVNPEGLSLDEALADLDEKYGQAEAAVAAS